LVVLSSKEEAVTKAEAFALGANDYLVKLPDKVELVARIRYHSQSYLNLLERNEAYRQLAESQRQLAEEVAQAARYVQSLLPERLSGAVRSDWKFVPSTQLGGDMFGHHWLDADHLAIYLLDVSGHGVGSSLLAVSANNVLAAQSLPNTNFRSPAAVLKGLNNAFTMEKQNGKYFTIWYGVYRRLDRRLLYSGGGHPAALLFQGPTGSPPERLKSQNLAVGMMPDYDFEESAVAVPENAHVLLYSDGVYEIDRPDGDMWRFEEFVEYLTKLRPEDGKAMDQLYGHIKQLHASDVLADDFSVLEVCF
jgi:sigma-B regulation protein RsbU (phosphoserine phosphatase)